LAATVAESAGQCARCGVSKQGRSEFSKAHLAKVPRADLSRREVSCT
ncbi:hypothetical protein T10_569, partial [Trichinella papuae]